MSSLFGWTINKKSLTISKFSNWFHLMLSLHVITSCLGPSHERGNLMAWTMEHFPCGLYTCNFPYMTPYLFVALSSQSWSFQLEVIICSDLWLFEELDFFNCILVCCIE